MPEWLKDAAPVIELVLVPLFTLGVKALFSIRDELRGVRGVIIRMEQWRTEHEQGHEAERVRINREFDMIHTRMTNGNGRYARED